MDHPNYDYAVIGGDMRQVYLAEELAHHATRISHYALCAIPDERRCSDASFVHTASSLEELCHSSHCIICPIPLCKNGIFINQSAFDEELSLSTLLSLLESGHSFFAGCIPEDFKAAACEKGVSVYDLMQNQSLVFYNTIATAEGAVCEAIKRSPVNLRQSRCAVLGYGKCAQTLVQYLKGMLCHVYVAANPAEEYAQAALLADGAGTLQDFVHCAEKFDYIFNTIPAMVLPAEVLAGLKRTVTIIDIAASPGGTDFTAAKKLGIHAALCPGLPGKYAPSSSAGAIRRTIENRLNEN